MSHRMQIFATIFFILQTTAELCDRTTYQWSLMLRKYNKWFGNVVMSDDLVPVVDPTYLALD